MNESINMLFSAFLSSGTTNVIVVDWSEGAEPDWAHTNVQHVSRDVTELIRLLVAHNKVSVARLHLIGFDYGAHIVGVTARRSTHNILRITGEGYFSGYWRNNGKFLYFHFTSISVTGKL